MYLCGSREMNGKIEEMIVLVALARARYMHKNSHVSAALLKQDLGKRRFLLRGPEAFPMVPVVYTGHASAVAVVQSPFWSDGPSKCF